MTKTDEKKQAIEPKSIGIGMAAALAVTLAALILSAAVISKEAVPLDRSGGLICLSAFAGAFVGGLAAARANRRSFVVTGLCAGLGLFCLRTVLASFAGRGGVFSSPALPLLAALIAGGLLGGLLAGKKKKRRKR